MFAISEEKELNLENPIFVHYINVDNMSRQSINDYLDHYSTMVNQYSNITNWIIATNYTKVECVYDGQGNKPGRMIDMRSVYSKEILRQKKIDVVLGLSAEFTKPTFADIINNVK